MSRLSSIRFAFALLFAAFAAHAQDNKPVDADKVLVTVTNKSDLELSVGLTLMPAPSPLPPPSAPGSTPSPAPQPSNQITEFRIRQTVQPQQQSVLQIPKGIYLVEASTAFSTTPSSPQQPIQRRLLSSFSHAMNDSIVTNELWTFATEEGPGTSLDPNDRVNQWKRTVHPARPAKPPDSGLRQAPTRTLRLAPGSEPDYGLRQIPVRSLKLAPNAPIPNEPLPPLYPNAPPPSFPTRPSPTPYFAPGLDKPQTPP